MQYISNKCAFILHEVSKNSPVRGWGGLSKMSKKMSKMSNKSYIFKQNWIISIRSRFIWYLVIWPNPTHWPTETPIHPPTHPWVGVSLQIINLQTELNYLDQVKTYSIVSHLTWPHPLTHWPTHPPTHPPMAEGVSTYHKSSNRIELSWLGQDLLKF